MTKTHIHLAFIFHMETYLGRVTVVFFLVFLQAPLTNSDTAVLSGSLSTHNGNGGGNINMTVRRVTSAKGWGEVCKHIQHMNSNYNVDVNVIYSILQLLLKKAFSVCCVLDVSLKSLFFLVIFSPICNHLSLCICRVGGVRCRRYTRTSHWVKGVSQCFSTLVRPAV